MVFVRPIADKKLLGSAGRHRVVTDRKVTYGGTDAGCTSCELLLLAMASCATGSIRNALAEYKLGTDDIRVEVNLVPPNTPGARDGILITVAAALGGMAFGRLVSGLVDRPKAFYPNWFYFLVEAVGSAALLRATGAG